MIGRLRSISIQRRSGIRCRRDRSRLRGTWAAAAVLGLQVILPSRLVAQPVVLETITRGDISYYRYADESFAGAELIIKDPTTWAWFWRLHTAGEFPPPPLPDVDFEQEVVLVALLGVQPTGGGPRIDIQGVDVDIQSYGLRVRIEDLRCQGRLDVLTNPYHIVKLARFFVDSVDSVLFEHDHTRVADCEVS